MDASPRRRTTSPAARPSAGWRIRTPRALDARQGHGAGSHERACPLPVLLVVDIEAFVSIREERRDGPALARARREHDARPGDLECAVLHVDLGQRLVLARVPGDIE